MNNPLHQYFRTPKLYIKLPSRGQFYHKDFMKLSVNQELAVYPLTAIDQIMLKTPDAMLNGESLLKVVKNCVPDVSDVKQLVEPDINSILLAIKIASSGPSLSYTTACPSCSAENNYNIEIQSFLDTQTYVDPDSQLTIDDALVVHVRPYNFEQRNLQLLNEIEESQSLKLLNSNEELNETQKMQELGNLVNSMANRTFELVSKSITHVTITQTGEQVTDPKFIEEFVKSISSTQANAIIDHIKELNRSGIKSETQFVCESCTHEWTAPVDFDPTSFFD